MKRIFKHFGFSLAEMLLTMTIVGVLAIMTLPTLKGNYDAHVTEARVKTTYNLISQAVLLSKNSGSTYLGDPKTWYDMYLKNNIKVSKECRTTASECWSNVTFSLSGSKLNIVNSDSVAVSLENGSNILITKVAKSTAKNMYGVELVDDANAGLLIWFDINGDDVPNKVGNDIYVMVWNGKEILPSGANKDISAVQRNCGSSNNGYFCLQYMMDNSWKINRKIFK